MLPPNRKLTHFRPLCRFKPRIDPLNELLFGRLIDGGRLTVEMKVTRDEKGVETGELQLDIQPLSKKEGRAKPEAEAAETN